VTVTEFRRTHRAVTKGLDERLWYDAEKPEDILLAVLLAMILATQDPALAQNGSVAGTLKTATGTPASRVRIAAAAVPRERSDALPTALVRVGETDEQGRYLLENLPPGRYFILAGRADLPTFYPGRLETAGGTILEISSGVAILGIDFAVDEASIRPAGIPVSIPVRVLLEGGGSLPESGAQKTTIQLRATDGTGGPEMPLNSTAFTIANTRSSYQVRVVNLPDGYVVTSMTFNGADLTTGLLTLPVAPAVRIITFTGEGKLQEAIDQAATRVAEANRTLSILLSRRDPANTPAKQN
jgi:hypothetical protein